MEVITDRPEKKMKKSNQQYEETANTMYGIIEAKKCQAQKKKGARREHARRAIMKKIKKRRVR